MKKLFAAFLPIMITMGSIAQTGKISGNLQNEKDHLNIDKATVSLVRSKDSSLVKTTVTDNAGHFVFENISPGNYKVKSGSITYSTAYSTALVSNGIEAVSAGTLQLVPINKELSNVTVTSKKQFVERKIDKTVINPEALISNTGTTAMEVLEKAPGVLVDKDGNISLKGKQGVIIMMDGKPTYMSSADLAAYLGTLPSSSIDQIEIMTNPSAKYDASGNSGIINIKTKKNKQKGFNGSLSASYGQGKYAKTNNSVNLNYRVGKINIFSNFGLNYRKNFNQLDINRVYSNDDKTIKAIFDQTTGKKRRDPGYNGKVGIDFYATKNTTFGLVFGGYASHGNEIGTSVSNLKNPSGMLDSIVLADRHEKTRFSNGSVNFNVRHSFDTTGKELSIDLDYITYGSGRKSDFINSVLNADQSLRYADHLSGDLPADIQIYSAKADYQQNIMHGIKMESGVKFSYVTTTNGANYFNVINGEKEVDYKKTNHFDYKENINAAYINFSRNIKKWGFQLGLRAENTNYEGFQYGNPMKGDSTFKKTYTNIFPTTYISYEANAKNQFGFSFGRRISRPDYEDLNPFLFFMDKYTYEEGNPFLKPMFSNVFELSHTYKQFLTTTLSYSHTTDMFNEVFRQSAQPDDSISTISSRGNYGIVDNLSLSMNAQVKVAKWYKVMLYAEGRYQHFVTKLNGEDIDINTAGFVTNINNQFTFKKGWSAELSGFYRTKTTEGQMTIRAITQIDGAVKKDIMKGKGSLRFSVRDITGPFKARGYMTFQNTAVKFQQQRDSQVFTLGFNYKFGKPIKGLKNRRSGGAGDEQNRIRSGN